jgi:regulatory protein YycI of two-component signal transduction system YycFG
MQVNRWVLIVVIILLSGWLGYCLVVHRNVRQQQQQAVDESEEKFQAEFIAITKEIDEKDGKIPDAELQQLLKKRAELCRRWIRYLQRMQAEQ